MSHQRQVAQQQPRCQTGCAGIPHSGRKRTFGGFNVSSFVRAASVNASSNVPTNTGSAVNGGPDCSSDRSDGPSAGKPGAAMPLAAASAALSTDAMPEAAGAGVKPKAELLSSTACRGDCWGSTA